MMENQETPQPHSQPTNSIREKALLERFYDTEKNDLEICLDEAGRGCLYGRVYIGSVVLPKDPTLFDGTNIKDSKKFTSTKKIQQVADYIKSHALYWNVSYIESNVIDEINILKSVMRGMHECINGIYGDVKTKEGDDYDASKIMILVDGNYFTPFNYFDTDTETIKPMRHITIEKGDSKYMGIAAASILAKTERDKYIAEQCKETPDLVTKYGLNTNMGYGTKKHIDGIREHGYTKDHRKSFHVTQLKDIQHTLL